MQTTPPLIQLPKDDNLALFTSHYPTNRRTYGKEVEKVWATAIKLTTVETMIIAVEAEKQSVQWKQGVIPLMNTWLNRQSWRNFSPTNPLSSSTASLTPVQMQIFNGEHQRILEAMKSISHSYAEHQSWADDDKQEFRKLKARRNELRTMLGIMR